MKAVILLTGLALVSACAAPHAVKVSCDRHLVPINAPSRTRATATSSATPSQPRSAAP
jgi:hypothetical protein